MKKSNIMIGLGSVEDFFATAKEIAHKLDKKEMVEPAHIVTFADPSDLIKFLSPKKMEVINFIKTHPQKTIKEISHLLQRNRSSISKDINSMIDAGIVKINVVKDPEQGFIKKIGLFYDKIVLQAAL
jgi:predicted transcriptional regulator